MKTVGIVVVNFNGSTDTQECLESLVSDSYRYKHIYVVDNGSAEDDYRKLVDAVEALRPFAEISVLRNSFNRGFSGGFNTGLARVVADGMEAALILNNDTTVEDGFLEALVNKLSSEPTLGMVGAKIFFYDDPTILWTVGGRVSLFRGGSRYFGRGVRDDGQLDDIDISHVSGCMALISRHALTSIGMFDERFFWRGEEWDYCYRMRKAGFKMALAPEARIFHKVSQSVDRFSRFDLYCGYRAKLLFVSKHMPAPFAYMWKAAFKLFLKTKYKKLVGMAESRGKPIMSKGEFQEIISKIYEDDKQFDGITLSNIEEFIKNGG